MLTSEETVTTAQPLNFYSFTLEGLQEYLKKYEPKYRLRRVICHLLFPVHCCSVCFLKIIDRLANHI